MQPVQHSSNNYSPLSRGLHKIKISIKAFLSGTFLQSFLAKNRDFD